MVCKTVCSSTSTFRLNLKLHAHCAMSHSRIQNFGVKAKQREREKKNFLHVKTMHSWCRLFQFDQIGIRMAIERIFAKIYKINIKYIILIFAVNQN